MSESQVDFLGDEFEEPDPVEDGSDLAETIAF